MDFPFADNFAGDFARYEGTPGLLAERAVANTSEALVFAIVSGNHQQAAMLREVFNITVAVHTRAVHGVNAKASGPAPRQPAPRQPTAGRYTPPAAVPKPTPAAPTAVPAPPSAMSAPSQSTAAAPHWEPKPPAAAVPTQPAATTAAPKLPPGLFWTGAAPTQPPATVAAPKPPAACAARTQHLLPAAAPKPTAAAPKPTAAAPKPTAAAPKPTAAAPKPPSATTAPTQSAMSAAAPKPPAAVAPTQPAPTATAQLATAEAALDPAEVCKEFIIAFEANRVVADALSDEISLLGEGSAPAVILDKLRRLDEEADQLMEAAKARLHEAGLSLPTSEPERTVTPPKRQLLTPGTRSRRASLSSSISGGSVGVSPTHPYYAKGLPPKRICLSDAASAAAE